MSGRAWTGAEEIKLRNAIEDGMTRVEICEMLGREKDTVRRKCQRLGIVLPPTVVTFKYEDRVYEQPPSSIERSTAALGKAINALIAKMDPRTLADCLGTPRQIPAGMERVLQTCAVERLAA
jgi:hypothetical protein